MRRGNGVGTDRIGGAWQCAAITPTEESTVSGASGAERTASTTDENETLWTDAGLTYGACIVGMVLQQS
jgi:hypothetical protein